MSYISHQANKIPSQIVWTVIIICILPFGLNLLGIDFATQGESFELEDALTWETHQLVDAMHHALAGSFVHTILEWSAFCAALLIFLLSFLNYSIKGNPITPTLGVALFFAGVMDAFHTLAADRLIDTVADPKNLIPFTWAICRLFHALIMIGGIIILLVHPSINHHPDRTSDRKKFGLIWFVSILFGIIAYSIIYFSSTSYQIPETMFPDAIITRPWDVIPLVLFLFAGLVLYPIFYRKQPTIFAHSLVISAIPNIATQVYMAFGSTVLFDNNFNVAHFLKIIAYLVPLVGICLEYVQIYQNQAEYLSKELEQSIRLLKSLVTQVLQSTKVTEMIRHSSLELESMIAQQVVGTEEIIQSNEKTLNISHKLCTTIQSFESTFTLLNNSCQLLSNQLIQISDGANHVNQIVHNITSIAAQTKMLSLNASIEAARSGRQSQEFTIIAREINQLATETSMVSQKIEPILQEMQSSVKNGVHQMNMFTQEHIQAMNPEMKLLHQNIKYQQQGANEISQAVVELNSGLEKTANYLKDTFQQTNVALQELEQSVATLQSEIARFSLPNKN